MRSRGNASRIIVVRQLSFHRRWSGFRCCARLEEPDITQWHKTLFTRIRPNVENIIGAIENGHALPALQRRTNLHRGHGAVEVNVAFLPAALNLPKLLCPATERQKKAKNKRIDPCAALHSSLANIKFVILGARVKPACSPVALVFVPTPPSQRKDLRPAIARPFKVHKKTRSYGARRSCLS